MMTFKEFQNKMIGVQWKNRESSFTGCDCYGLVLLFYKHVCNIDIEPDKDYTDENIDLNQGFAKITKGFIEVSKPSKNGLMFVTFKDKKPTHVGVVISKTHVLHCFGNLENGGSVKIHSIRTLKNVYGKMKFYKYQV